LSVNGSNLKDKDPVEGPFVVFFGSDALMTTVVSDSLLTATVPAQEIAQPRTVQITVGSADFGSNAVTFQILPPASGAQVSPSEVKLGPKGSQQFTASVEGSSSVSWSIEEGASGGSITDTGFYTPNQVGTFHVVAASTANPTENATATVSVVAAGFGETGSMHSARSGHTATLLKDGKVLILGGGDRTAEVFDPASGTFSLTGNPLTNRFAASATLLADGTVLIAGGVEPGPTGPFPASDTAEIFHPATGTFTPTGNMLDVRHRHTATLLNDGKVLIIGGDGSSFCTIASSELFDPVTGTFSSTGSLLSEKGRMNNTATLLSSGEVLIAGGSNGCAPDAADDPPWDPLFVELYNATSGSFHGGGDMSTTRIGHAAVRLTDGRVLMLGGIPAVQNLHEQPANPWYAEWYDPAALSFSPVTGLMISQKGYTATPLSSGMVLIAGGVDAAGHPTSEVDQVNPDSGTISTAGGLVHARTQHTATLLKDGRVLVTGGVDSDGNALASAELYQ
jgi:hypothetical protein